MDRIEILEKKVRLAAEQLISLKEEKQKMLAEIKYLEDENKRAKELLRENDNFREEKKQSLIASKNYSKN